MNGASTFPTVNLSLYEFRNDVKYDRVSNFWPKNSVNVNPSGYFFTITKNGQEIMAGAKDKGFETATVTNNVVTKAAKGIYIVTAYKKTATGADRVAETSFELYDSQEMPTLELVKSTTSIAISPSMSPVLVNAVFSECFRLKYAIGTIPLSEVEPKYQIVGTSAIFFESVKIKQTYVINNSTVFYYYDIPVGKTVMYQ